MGDAAVAKSPAERPASEKADWTLVKRLLAYLAAHRRLFWLTFVLYPIDTLSVIVPPYLVQQILDVAVPRRDERLLLLYGGLYVAALVVEYASGFASQFVMNVLGQRAMRAMRADLYSHVQRLSARYFDHNPVGRVLTRLTNDVDSLAEVFATGAVTVLADALTIVAVVGMMLWLDWRLTLFAFLVVPPLVILAWAFQRYARRAFRAIRKHLAAINAFLSEHLGGMGVVQIFQQEARSRAEFDALNGLYRDANRSAILFDALLYSVVEAIGTCAVAALIWYGAGSMSAGLVGAGTLVAFIHYIRRFFVPVRDLSTKYTILQSAFAAAERVFQLLDEPVEVASPKDALPVGPLREGVALEHVWFAYREGGEDKDWVLRDVSLRVAKGERVALVGASGSGKTTVLKLLNRTYDVQRGRVTVDGVDVRALDVTAVRRLFSVVLQDVHLFSGTVMENLALAEEVSPEAVREAARAVQVTALIDKLPKGYDTPVQELGSNFSAGERQLLAFARALALNPQVLVLDEATSNVDTETEARIQAALDVLLRDRTAIIVAHRLSTVRKVDRIVVFQGGRIVEEGDHGRLMGQDGVYRRLVELQMGVDNAGAA